MLSLFDRKLTSDLGLFGMLSFRILDPTHIFDTAYVQQRLVCSVRGKLTKKTVRVL
jgi:hypothetical protein